jgi:hypothetical protein
LFHGVAVLVAAPDAPVAAAEVVVADISAGADVTAAEGEVPGVHVKTDGCIVSTTLKVQPFIKEEKVAFESETPATSGDASKAAICSVISAGVFAMPSNVIWLLDDKTMLV